MLVPLLKLISFIVVTLWSLLTRLIFNTVAHTLVLLLQGLKGSGEGSLGVFQQVANGIRGCFQLILQIILGSMNSIISKVFDVLKESFAGSVAASGSVATELAEKLKTSLEDSMKQVPQVFEELSNMTSKMVTDLWNNFKDVLEDVKEKD